MGAIQWDQRFLSSTRGQIIALLRRGAQTVDELAQPLDLTDNAVRAHLTALERDGLVEQRGLRRGGGKPAYTYMLTVDAERLFAAGYVPVLNELLAVLLERHGDDAVEETLRAVGQRLAGEAAEGDVQARLDAAAQVLTDLGGLAEGAIEGDQITIQGYGCPLTAVSSRHCKICKFAEALVTEIVGLPMQEECERGERPRCRFVGTLA